MTIFKQSASTYIHQFLMVLSSDGVTGYTGAANTITVKLGKNGASGVTAAGSVSLVDSTNLPGTYAIAFTAGDLNTAGSLVLDATAATCNHTTEYHRVDPQVFTDLALDANGNAKVSSNIKINTAVPFFPFTMTVGGVPTPGLTVTAQKNFGSGFSNIGGTVTDLGNGTYKCNLLNTDTNNAFVLLRFTAPGADDRDISFSTTP